MFAIIEIGGNQYKVEKGEILEVEKIDSVDGSTFTVDNVLLINDGSSVKIGTPTLEGAFVEAKLLNQTMGDKVKVYKMKAKDRYQRKTGHRQKFTKIEILDIKSSGGVKKEKAPAAEKPATKKAAPKKAKKKA
ncbi:MAG TPA: 50S ribosomal protein L21 [Candidatus Portnoybacteria bacterium]|nr:50S ribosomal protein L21 [Candidatus Portnoybacteria bacterium]